MEITPTIFNLKNINMDKGQVALLIFVVLAVIFIIWSTGRNEDSLEFRENIITRMHEVNREYIRDSDFNRDTLLYYNTLEIQILEAVQKDKLNCSLKPLVLKAWLSPEEIRYLEKYRKFD